MLTRALAPWLLLLVFLAFPLLIGAGVTDAVSPDTAIRTPLPGTAATAASSAAPRA